MNLRFDVVLATAAIAGLLVTITGWLAYHEHQQADAARVSYAAVSKLQADNRNAYRLRYQPVPSLRSVTAYPAPYNITIVCTVRGSSAAGDTRVPLNPKAAPQVGDVYVKTCLALAPSEAPTG